MWWSKCYLLMEQVQAWSDQETKSLQKPFQSDGREADTSWNCPGCYYLGIKFLQFPSQATKILWDERDFILNKDHERLRRIRFYVLHRTQFVFKGKREHIAKVNMSNMAYPNQHIDNGIPFGLRDHAIVPDTIKMTFNLDIEWIGKARSIVNDVGRVLVKKKALMLVSKEIGTINDSDIYDTYKDLYLSGKVSQWLKGTGGCKKKQMAQHWQWQPRKMRLKRHLMKYLKYR